MQDYYVLIKYVPDQTAKLAGDWGVLINRPGISSAIF